MCSMSGRMRKIGNDVNEFEKCLSHFCISSLPFSSLNFSPSLSRVRSTNFYDELNSIGIAKINFFRSFSSSQCGIGGVERNSTDIFIYSLRSDDKSRANI